MKFLCFGGVLFYFLVEDVTNTKKLKFAFVL